MEIIRYRLTGFWNYFDDSYYWYLAILNICIKLSITLCIFIFVFYAIDALISSPLRQNARVQISRPIHTILLSISLFQTFYATLIPLNQSSLPILVSKRDERIGSRASKSRHRGTRWKCWKSVGGSVLGDLERSSPRNFVTIRESAKSDFVTRSKHDIMRPTLIVKPVAPTSTKITSNVRPGQGSKKAWEFNGGSRTFLLLPDGISIRGSLIY